MCVLMIDADDLSIQKNVRVDKLIDYALDLRILIELGTAGNVTPRL
jgi:hypothetical protein